MIAKNPERYHFAQVILHWLVVCAVLIQYATSGAIARTHSPSLAGLAPSKADLFLHSVHNRCGLLILLLIFMRLAFRTIYGVPSSASGQSFAQIRMAGIVHWLLYATLLAQAITGATAAYVWWPASAIHKPLFYIFASLAALHIFAAFYHHFKLRDDTLLRMLRLR